MANRRPNHRLVKIHRTYDVDDIVRLLSVHRNTVREWIRRGLETCDAKRPTLIRGTVLKAYLENRRKMSKRPCTPDEIYCVRCRLPRRPAADLVEYQALTTAQGTLVAICPTCEAMMYRRIAYSEYLLRWHVTGSAHGPARLLNDRSSSLREQLLQPVSD